jgi:hypothetical protein
MNEASLFVAEHSASQFVSLRRHGVFSATIMTWLDLKIITLADSSRQQ